MMPLSSAGMLGAAGHMYLQCKEYASVALMAADNLAKDKQRAIIFLAIDLTTNN